MSEPLKSIHVRLSPEAHRVLATLADIEDKDAAEMLRIIAEESLLGRVHTLILAAERFKRLGLRGITGDLEGLAGGARK